MPIHHIRKLWTQLLTAASWEAVHDSSSDWVPVTTWEIGTELLNTGCDLAMATTVT